MMSQITMVHGSGGAATSELIQSIFAESFNNETLNRMEDSAVVNGYPRIAVTTDSFVVTPIFFRGGDIGRLAVCGTVNDLLMRGAVPKYLTCGFILEEGLPIEGLKKAVRSMAETAREAGVTIVAGDTKVISGNGGMYINTTGVGFIYNPVNRTDEETDFSFEGELEDIAGVDGLKDQGYVDIAAGNAREGDVIIVSGELGDHHAAILSERLNIQTDICSDNAPLTEMVIGILRQGLDVHTMRDVTRGGLGTVLKELAEASGKIFEIDEEKLPVSAKVRDFCGLLGLDPVYMGNEGKLVLIISEEDKDEALEIIRSSKYGEKAQVIGRVRGAAEGEKTGSLIMNTTLGGRRSLEILQGEGLPRIC